MNLARLIPTPIRDVVLGPFSIYKGEKEAVSLMVKSSIRIAIAAAGAFASYKMFQSQPHSPSNAMASLLIPVASVYLISLPAGDILFGSECMLAGTAILVHAVGSKAMTLLDLGTNLTMAALGIGVISAGWMAMNDQRQPGHSLGIFEPVIDAVAGRFKK